MERKDRRRRSFSRFVGEQVQPVFVFDSGKKVNGDQKSTVKRSEVDIMGTLAWATTGGLLETELQSVSVFGSGKMVNRRAIRACISFRAEGGSKLITVAKTKTYLCSYLVLLRSEECKIRTVNRHRCLFKERNPPACVGNQFWQEGQKRPKLDLGRLQSSTWLVFVFDSGKKCV